MIQHFAHAIEVTFKKTLYKARDFCRYKKDFTNSILNKYPIEKIHRVLSLRANGKRKGIKSTKP